MKSLRPRADTKALEAAQYRACAARDGNVCRLERKTRSLWHECGSKSDMSTVHIIRRADCGSARFDPNVVLRGCWSCHKRLDGNTLSHERQYEVRVPYDRAVLARDTVLVALLAKGQIATYGLSPKYDPDANPELYADVLAKRGAA